MDALAPLTLADSAWLAATALGLVTHFAEPRLRTWRARRQRFEALKIAREVERRRRYYCRRALRDLDDTVARLEREMTTMPVDDLLA